MDGLLMLADADKITKNKKFCQRIYIKWNLSGKIFLKNVKNY